MIHIPSLKNVTILERIFIELPEPLKVNPRLETHFFGVLFSIEKHVLFYSLHVQFAT
jgi:hypothetical protein